MTSLKPKLLAAITTIAMAAPIAGAQAATPHTLHHARPNATSTSQRYLGHFRQSITTHTSATSATFHRHHSSWA
jgi:hypothetical protein